jgi:hypothetical protein
MTLQLPLFNFDTVILNDKLYHMQLTFLIELQHLTSGNVFLADRLPCYLVFLTYSRPYGKAVFNFYVYWRS